MGTDEEFDEGVVKDIIKFVGPTNKRAFLIGFKRVVEEDIKSKANSSIVRGFLVGYKLGQEDFVVANLMSQN